MGSDSSKELPADDMEKLKEQTAFSAREIREWYQKFHADYPSGVISKDEFIAMYQQMFPEGDATHLAEYIFRAYDVDKNGEISFQEFMCTLSVSTRGKIEDKLAWAFRMYDLDGNGVVTRKEATEIISAIYRMKGKGDRQSAEEAALQLFVSLDKNQNDHLSEAEFILGIKRNRDIMNILDHSGGR